MMNSPEHSTLPGGTVTFLFTDIAGSTQLLQQLGGDQYGELLSAHRVILRAAFDQFGGREIDTQGDSFFASFPRASDAVKAVIQMQAQLAAHPWPDGAQVRVRMGLHTGEPWLAEEGYIGMDVHRAARIAHSGHGGQVLLSETTTSLVQHDLPADVRLLDLGRHRLKDMRRLRAIHQLVIPGLPAEFPALNSLDSLPPVSLSSEAEQILREPRAVGPCPYRGLAAFRETDARFFFGRETFAEQLYETVTRQPMTAVIVGSSGAGKSSAIAAGLLPRLRKEGGWLSVRFRPGREPFHTLAAVFIPILEPELSETQRLLETGRLAAALREDEISLFQVVQRAVEQGTPNQRLLLVADQFEELYTLCPDPDLRAAFLDELLAAVAAGAAERPAPFVLLLTLRADFMGQALTHRPFADELQQGALLLGPMNREELRTAIEQPAELQGAAFETGLVARILDDVGQEPGNLPLLEFALTLLWDQMDQGWLTHETYEKIGGVDGALAKYADDVLDALPDAEQAQARRVFVQLVQPGEGTEDTRRVASKANVGAKNWVLIQHLADRRLVVTGQDEAGNGTVEVVHEALIRSWGKLQAWMNTDRTFRAWQEGLRAAIRGWEGSQRDEGGLLRGGPLVQAEDWLAERGGEIGDSERAYIQASADLRTRRQAERERRQQLTIGGLAVGLVIAVILSVFAFGQRGIAQQNESLAKQSAATAEAESISRATQQAIAEFERERAEEETQARATQQTIAEEQRQVALVQASIGLAAQSVAELEGTSPERAVLLALEALENYPYSPEAESALALAVEESRPYLLVSNPNTRVTDAAWSPDGTRFVTGSAEHAIIWDAITGEELLALPPQAVRSDFTSMWAVEWTPDSKRIVSVYADKQIKVWDAVTGEEIVTYTGHKAKVVSISLSPDGSLVASGSSDGIVKIWNLNSAVEVQTLTDPSDEFSDLAWSPTGDKILTTSLNGSARVLDAATGSELSLISGQTSGWTSAGWSPDGQQFGLGSEDGTTSVWDANTGEILYGITGHTKAVKSVEWSPDSKLIATASSDGTARIWEAATGEQLLSLYGLTTDLWRATWSPDGKRLITGGGLGLRVWDVSRLPFRLPSGTKAAPTGDADWSPDGRRIATMNDGGIAKVWDAFTGEELTTFTKHNGDIVGFFDWSPNGNRIITTGFFRGEAWVWDARTGSELVLFKGHGGAGLNDVAWSPAGDYIVTTGFDYVARVWDADTGVEIAHFGSSVIDGPSWSPDGSRVATSDLDGVARIWDALTGVELLSLAGHAEGGLSAANFSPDGTFLVTSSSADHNVKVWDAITGEERITFSGHNEIVWDATWSPNGKRIVSGDETGTVKVWDASTGEEVLSFATGAVVFNVNWSPDGSYVIVSGGNPVPTIRRVWQSTDELIAYAHECCMFRELSASERELFGLEIR